MINFQLGGICAVLRQLGIEEQEMASRVGVHEYMPVGSPGIGIGGLSALGSDPSIPIIRQPLYISAADKKRIEEWLKYAEPVCVGIYLNAAVHRIQLFTRKLGQPMKGVDFIAEVRALRETMEGEIQAVYFFHYQPIQANTVLRFAEDWGPVVSQFPSAKADAFSAVDCWAMGQSTAAVFHLMRVAEYGLRALARERSVSLPKGRPLEWGDWHQIIEGIGKKVELIANKKAGKKRDGALEFYRGSLGEFQAFKDAYRNNVMHTRRSYDEHEARSVMNHVREFMTRLAAKIGENPKTIRWGKMT